MAIEGGYAPPGVYTQTVFQEQNQNSAQVQGKIPTLIGVGRQTIESKENLLVRGSSSTSDQQIVEEDATGRMISGENPNGSYILADYNGVHTEISVRHYPIVTGDGTGTTSISPSSVSASINGTATVVLEVSGATGKIILAEAPSLGDDVRVSYYFNRTDKLVTDESLTTQVSSFQTEIQGSASTFVVTEDSSTLILTCDGQTKVITLAIESVRADSLNKVVNAINGAVVGSLEASKYTDQNGSENLLLTANGSIKVGSGNANTVVGVYTNQAGTPRTITFYTAHKPIVDGSNGGIASTNVSNISVKVDGVLVVASSLDGANGSFTLASPPKVGSTVTATYYHNTFKDQFDYITGRDVTSIDRVSLVASGGGSSALYIQNVDFVLHNDKIVWGTASLVSTGETQLGGSPFGSTQVSATLRDEKAYLLECAPVTNTTVIPPRVLANVFKLPYQPVDGSGNGLPSSSTALITVRTGISFSDALENSVATVTKVDPVNSQITLATAPATNHKVYATFFYSNIQDKFDLNAYNVAVESVGASSIGTYTITSGTSSLYGAEYTTKGTDLTAVVIAYPSGSEALTGAHVSGGIPVEEAITLEFGDFEETSAIFFAGGSAPYYLVDGQSDTLAMTIDAQAVSVDFSVPTGSSRLGNITHVVGDVLPYTAESNNANLGDVKSTSVDLVVDGVALASAGFTAQTDQTVAELVTAINTQANLVKPTYTAMSPMGAWEAKTNTYKVFKFRYVGNNNGSFANLNDVATIAEAVYANATALATAVQTAITAAITAREGGEGKFGGLAVTVTADSSARLVFTLDSLPSLNGGAGAGVKDDFGFIEFAADDETSFLSIAGIDFDEEALTILNTGKQTKFGFLPVATKVSTALGGGALRDRLVLKNRTLIGNTYFPPVDLGLSVTTGTNLELMGISPTLNVVSSRTSVLDKPSVKLTVGWTEVDGVSGIPAKTMYDGTGAEDANNVLSFTINGTPLTATLTASGGGAERDIAELITTINTALGAHGTAIREGQYIRIVSAYDDTNSYIKVGSGSANSAFGLTANTVVSTKGVSAQALSDALMSNLQAGADIKDGLFSVDQETNDADKFGTNAVALIHTDAVGKQSLGFESLEAGVDSILDVTTCNIATTKGTGLKITTASGAVGEASHQGFNLSSNNGSGTGSSNTSTLKNAVGADGKIGQTYIDSVTGFTITVLAREGAVSYPTGANAQITFNVSTSIKTNANIPQEAILGVSLTVSNTLDTAIGDNALVETFYKGGKEPSIGQTYYIDFTRVRSLFNTRTFSNLADVINTYGAISLENTLSMGAYLAFSNGANAIACKQIQLEQGQNSPTEVQVTTALADLEGEIVAGLSPNLVLPLVSATSTLLSAISNHCDVQSSLRYRSERRAVMGCAVGTQPRDAQTLASATGNSRVCLVYPDMAKVSFVDSSGVVQSYLVGGEFVSVAVAMATTNPNFDSATPWTNKTINGFTVLGRTLDDVDANTTANAGVTVLKQTVNGIQVRHGLTTNMTSILTKTPTVIQIADDVHLRCRNLLNRYIGNKFVPNTINQIEGKVNGLFKQLVRDQIIATYTGLTVTTDPSDPTGLLIDVFYKPVYPLLYIQFTFTVQGG